MRMEFRKVQDGKVCIAATDEDCRDLIGLIEGARDSDFNLYTYASTAPEKVEQVLVELRAGSTDGQIALSEDVVANIFGILSAMTNVSGLRGAVQNEERLSALDDDIGGVFKQAFPDACQGPY